MTREKKQHELRVIKLGYKVKVTETSVKIFFEDGDIYASFKLKKDDNSTMYYIFLNDELINDEVDFYDSYEEALESCFYYFLTRF